MRPSSGLLLLLPAALALTSCGGSGPSAFGQIAGSVFDADGNPVRDARVYLGSGGRRETRTNSFGSYLLDRAGAEDVVVKAEVDQGNARYFGQNVATVFEGERAKNVNVVVYPRSQLASLEGATYDRGGNRLSGVRVFVRPIGTNVLSAAQGISDSRGNFLIEGLLADTNYELVANGRGYGDDTDTFRLRRGERQNLVVTLGNPLNNAVQPPTDLVATAWTSPREISRDAQLSRGIEAVKLLIDPKRAKRSKLKGRDTIAGNPVEIELVWNRTGDADLLGYGVYRGSNGGTLQNVDFLRDPLAEIYVDSSQILNENVRYDLALTSLGTLYPDTKESESVLSDVVSVVPLGDLFDNGVNGGANPTFNWSLATGATKYSVFLFNEYPRLGVTSRFNNFDNPVRGSSYTYDGPALSPGATYFYLILGTNEDGSARTLSRIESFVAR